MTHLTTLDVPAGDSDASADSTRIGLTDSHSHFVTFRHVEECIAAGHDAPDGMPRSCWFDLADGAFPYHVRALTDLVEKYDVVWGIDRCWTPAPTTTSLAGELDGASPPSKASNWRTLLELNARALLDKPASDHWTMKERHG
jgi:hypothetical protein